MFESRSEQNHFPEGVLLFHFLRHESFVENCWVWLRSVSKVIRRKLFLLSRVYLIWISLFGRWPRQIVSSIGLCRYGGRTDCCWGWARRAWGQCQREYQPRGLQHLGGGLSTVGHGFTLHIGGLITEQGFLVWELPLTSYSAPFQPEPATKVRYQFCYSQSYLGRSFEHLSSVPCVPIRLTLCCGLWDGGKIVSLDCIYSK